MKIMKIYKNGKKNTSYPRQSLVAYKTVNKLINYPLGVLSR